MAPRIAEGEDRVEVPATEARQASREGVVRYVLMASLAAVIVAFIIAYLIS
ncbi:MAG: hypothetical protein JO010_01035 [Alphaproteobacteria bacterium]|nr:hypothetical protein [Alphaproteobacteria bacterium]